MKIIKKIVSLSLCVSMFCIMTAFADNTNQMVTIDLWNAYSDQASMGNIATDNNKEALYNPTDNTLQIATNPVDVSGYMSGIVSARYDSTGNGDYVDVTVLSTFDMETGTKNDGTNHTITTLSSFEIVLPDYLTKEGIEYIYIQMSVPHTPMDVVVGTGYLDARLRINWDTLTATTDTQITPDTTMSSGTVKSVELSDKGFEIKSDTTVMPENTVLSITEITSGTDFDTAKATLGVADFDLYNVELTAGGQEITLSGTMEIKLPYLGSIELYRINADGSKTVLRGTASDDGYTILSRSAGMLAVIGGEKMEVETEEETTALSTFTDVSGHWAENYIFAAVEKGLFNGTSDTTFSPESKMTASMVITVLHRMAGTPSATAQSTVWYAEAMAWGYENEIIGGYKDFDGEANVTREELATMIYRYEMLSESASEQNDLSAFEDFDKISSWAIDGLSWANAKGIVTGTSTTIIAPQNEATRAEVATMLCRFIS